MKVILLILLFSLNSSLVFAGKNEMLGRYTQKANGEEAVSFLGRLGTFRYLDMDVTVAEALKACELIEESFKNKSKIPNFFN